MEPMMAMMAAQMAAQLIGKGIAAAQGSQQGRIGRIMAQSANYAAAASNPKSKLNKAATAEAARELYQAIAAGINQQFQAQRKASARGMLEGMFNSDRADQARFLATSQARMQADTMAGKIASDRLLGSANALNQWLGATGQMQENQMAQREADKQNADVLAGGLGALFGKALGNWGNTSSSYNTQTPTTNTYSTSTDVPMSMQFTGQMWR